MVNKEPESVSTVLYLLLLLAFSVHASVAGQTHVKDPLSPRAYLMQYWDNEIPTTSVSQFLLSRASPLTTTESMFFAGLASENVLSAQLDSFCESANLFCVKDTDLPQSLEQKIRNIKAPVYYLYNIHYHYNHVGHKIQVCEFYKRKTPVADDENDNRIERGHGCAQPGMFFREKMLKSGTIMPLPDIRDKMPRRSFLPRSIVSKLPFSSSKLMELKHIFLTSDRSRIEAYINATLWLCEQKPSVGETKRCVGSAEDMIDFAVSMLGRSIKVSTTKNANGSGKDVMLGKVRAIDGGKVTKSVSCHQSLYPYLIYLCHALPNVRVYEADILNLNTKVKINRGSAVCHLDTTSWSPDHTAFSLLGSAPGEIEVCHWFFQNDLAWTVDD